MNLNALLETRYVAHGLSWPLSTGLLALVLGGLSFTLWRRGQTRRWVVSFLPLWTSAPGVSGLPSVVRARRWRGWLAAAAALLAVFAAVDPRPVPGPRRGSHVIVAIDERLRQVPGGLAAVDARLNEIARGLAPADRLCAIGFAESARWLSRCGSDPLAARSALQAASSASASPAGPPRGASVDEAAKLAQAIAEARPGARLVVVGPGGYEAMTTPVNLPLSFAPTAPPAFANVAAVSLGAIREGDEVQIVLRLRNDGRDTVEARVDLRTGWDAHTAPQLAEVVALAPRGRATLVRRLPDTAAALPLRIEARVHAPAGANAVERDDRLEVTLPIRQPAKVLLLGRRNTYLLEALRSLSRRVDVFAFASPHELSPGFADADLLVFNEVDPPASSLQRNTLSFLHAEKADPQARVIERPAITRQAGHALLAHLDLPALNVRRARVLPDGAARTTLAESFGAPLMDVREESGAFHVRVGFSLRQSDLVWRPELPLLLENVLERAALAPPAAAHAFSRPLPSEAAARLFREGSPAVPIWQPAPKPNGFWHGAQARPARPALALALISGIVLILSSGGWVRGRGAFGVASAAGALVLVTLALSGPQLPLARSSPRAVVVANLRAPPDDGQRRWLARLHASAERHLDHPVNLRVFAGGEAAARAAAWVEAGGPAHVFLVNEPGALPLRPRPDDGRSWHEVAPPSRQEPVVSVGDWQAPPFVRAAEVFRLGLPVEATQPTTLRIQVSPASVRLVDPPRPTDLAVPVFDLPVAPGRTTLTFEAQVERAPGDRIEATLEAIGANGAQRRVVHPFVVPPTRVLVLTERSESVVPFVQALTAQRFEVNVRGPKEPPNPDAYALIVLSDLPRQALPDHWLAALAEAVDAGAGLLVAGGPLAFAGGGWHASPLAPLLPVTLDLPSTRPVADLALALVLDRSGSMAKGQLALTRQAVQATTLAMRPTDLVTVIAFDSRAETIVPLQPAGHRAGIWADLERLVPGGGTDLGPALRQAHRTLASARAQRRHVILLSDGHAPRQDLRARIEELARAEITVSAVAMGQRADVAVLRRLAEAGGGRFHLTDDAARVPRIFTNDLVLAAPRSHLDGARRVRPAAARGLLPELPWPRAPALGGISASRARDDARVLLQTDRSEPLLVSWNVGAGRVAVFTADVAGPWLVAWPRWSGYQPLWAAVAKYLLPGDPDHTFGVELQDTPAGRLARLAPTRNGVVWTGLEGELQVRAAASPHTRGWSVPLWETEPGVYAAWLPSAVPPPLTTPVAAHLRARLAPPESAGALLTTAETANGLGHVAWPPAALPRSTSAGQTSKAPNPDGFASRVLKNATDVRPRRKVPLAPWLSAAASLLFVAAFARARATVRASKN